MRQPPQVEPYRMVEPKQFSDTELAAFGRRKQRSLAVEALWFAARFMFWMAVIYFLAVGVLL